MNYDHFDQFEAYTDNALPADKRKDLERQLATGAALRAELDEYRQFRHSIESVALKRQLEQLHTRLDRQGAFTKRPMPPAIARPRRLRPIWATVTLAILVLAGFGLYWAMRPTPAEQLFLAYYQPEPIARGLNSCGPELTPGLQAYRAGNYQQALADIEKLSVDQPCVRYYRGLAQLGLNNVPLAIVELERAVSQRLTAPDLTIQKAEWYLALAYLMANRTDDAPRQLRTIANQPGHPFQQVAKKALTDGEHA